MYYCYNCGSYNHNTKYCLEPKISLGIICVKIDNFNFNKNITNINFNINSFNYKNICNLSKLNFYKDKIKFLLVSRKYSLNYIEFLRGNYDETDLEKLNYILNLMSKNEINNLKKYSFDYLWKNLWKNSAYSKNYEKEYNYSKKKFNYLKNNDIFDLLKLNPWDDTEWEFPKGRRNFEESNLESAIREFSEETHINSESYYIFNNLSTINDNFTGTNNKKYRYIYYLGLLNNNSNICLSKKNYDNNLEIKEAKWFTWYELINIIRPYYKNKLTLINSIFLFFVNLCENLKKLNRKVIQYN